MEIKLWASDDVPGKCFNLKFLQGMVNRLIVGYWRYEINTTPEQRDYLKRIEKTLKKYKDSGNREYLIDLANYAMREFDYPHRVGTYLKSVDSNGRNRKD